MKIVLLMTLRIVALGLCFLSVHRAWAGWEVFVAESEIKEGAVNQGIERLEQSMRVASLNPQAYDLYGRTLQNLFHQDFKEPVSEEAVKVFKKMTEIFPYYGRAWLYRAQANGGRSPDYHKWLDHALEKEPTSGWMNYAVGVLMLAQNRQLTSEEIDNGLKKIRKGTSVRFKGQTSYNLEAALDFLWKRFSKFSHLEYVTPKDRLSYGVLRKYVVDNKLLEYQPYVNGMYQKISKIDYKRHIEKGTQALSKHNYEDALNAFDEAYWMSQYELPARVGLVVARYSLNQAEKVSEKELREILESENVPMIKALQPVIHKVLSPYIVGLYNYQLGHYRKAIESFKKVTNKDLALQIYRRRPIAYWNLGEKVEALKPITRELSKETPDLVSLGWWAELKTPFQSKVRQRLDLLSHTEIAPAKWVMEDEKTPSHTLAGSGRLGTIVPFRPGSVELRIEVRGKADQEGSYPYLSFGYWDDYRLRPIKEYYLQGDRWHTVSLKFETRGGYRWLWLQSTTGDHKAAGSLAQLEIGRTTIIYSNE